METYREERKDLKEKKAVGRRAGDVPPRLVECQVKKSVGGWMAVMSLSDMQMTLSQVEIRDGLQIRTGITLLGAPTHCDMCGAVWSVSYSLSCPHGGVAN